MGLGTNAAQEHRRHQAFLGLLTGLLVAVGFIFLGKGIFAALGITVADFQVAGELILLALAFRELVVYGRADRDTDNELGFLRSAIRLIAGPRLLTEFLFFAASLGLFGSAEFGDTKQAAVAGAAWWSTS